MSYLENIIKVAKSTGDILLEFYKKELDVTYKDESTESPVTQADLAADEHIKNEIRKFSDLPLLSEEKLIDYEERKSWKDFWLVDPLDGTKDFIAHSDEFCVLIALIQN